MKFKVCEREFFKVSYDFKECGREFFELLEVSTLRFEKVWKRVFRVVGSFNLKVWESVEESSSCCWRISTFKCLRVSCKGFALWQIAIEWERFQVRYSNISKFFILKFSHFPFLWIEKHRVFVLAFVKLLKIMIKHR